MVVDSSAVIAILQKEEAILAAERCLISAATLAKGAMVSAARRGQAGAKELDALLALSVAFFNSDGVRTVPRTARSSAS